MPARHQQQQIGEANILGETRRESMRFQMVHSHQRLAERQSQRLAGREPHQHPADQARSSRCRDAIEVRHGDARLVEGIVDHPVEDLDMGARGNLRTTPPNGACSFTCERMRFDRMRRVPSGETSTMAAEVSSHVVSRPRTRMGNMTSRLISGA